MPHNILNLPRYNVLSAKEEDHDYHIKAETVCPPKTCLACGSEDLVGGGRQEVLVKDTPMYGKRVGIYVQARRLRCRGCGKTHTERLPDVVEGQRITSRLYRFIGEQSVKKTFTSIAHDVGVSEGTVRGIFNEYVTELERTAVFETPTSMGIDEIHIIGKCRGVITNIEARTVVNLLPDRNKPLIQNYFMRLKDRQTIKCVAMDMWLPYKDAVYGCLPNAVVVVDKFHVVKTANYGLETVRKGIRADLTPKQRRGLMHDRFVLLKREAKLEPFDRLTLETWTKNFPALGEAYRAKERFYGIYEAKSAAEAKAAYLSWKDSLAPGISDAFKPLVTCFGNWETEILNYFAHPVTNGYTECLNGLTRVIDRSGRGYSFEALRAKILFTAGANKIVVPKFERKPRRATRFEDFGYGVPTASFGLCGMDESTETAPPSRNLGTDISTLLRMMDDGEA
jgi:transposase